MSSEGRAWASRTVLKILCKSSSVYLATGGSTTGGLTGILSWLDFGGGEDPNGPLELCSLRGRPRPWIEVILVVEQSRVDPKQRYSNGLVDPLGIEQLEL